MRRGQQGFTLVELVVVLVLVGVVAAVAAPRLIATRAIDEIAFLQDTRAALRYAQRAAIAQHRLVCVSFTATTISFSVATTFGGACSTGLAGPAGEIPYRVTTSGPGFTTVPAALTFDALGVPNAGQTLALAGGSLVIEAGTGYVH